MNSESYQEQKKVFEIGDMVCYRKSFGHILYGIVTDTREELVKIYWCIDKNDVDISPLSYPPIRKDGWIAEGILRETGSLKIVSKKS